MKNKVVRYFLNRDAKILHEDNGEKFSIPFTFSSPIFVDILGPLEGEGSCESIKVRLFLPNGDIKTGNIVGYCISIYNKDALYDGRFNSTQN